MHAFSHQYVFIYIAMQADDDMSQVVVILDVMLSEALEGSWGVLGCN